MRLYRLCVLFVKNKKITRITAVKCKSVTTEMLKYTCFNMALVCAHHNLACCSEQKHMKQKDHTSLWVKLLLCFVNSSLQVKEALFGSPIFIARS